MYVSIGGAPVVMLGKRRSKAGAVAPVGVAMTAAQFAIAGSVAGPYGAAIGAAIGAAYSIVGGLMGKSATWRGFAARLAKTIQADGQAAQTLSDKVAAAKSLDELRSAVAEFNAAVAHGRPTPAGAYEILTPPGATGTAHEGGAVADFEPAMAKIREAIALKVKSFIDPVGVAAPKAAGPLQMGMFAGLPWWLWIGGGTALSLVAMVFDRPRRA